MLYRWICYLALPLLFLLVNLLARVDEWPAALPQQPWLPFLTLTTWAGISLFHVVWIAYVYDLPRTPVHYLPALWVLAWTLHHRLRDLNPAPRANVGLALLVVPAATSLLMYLHGWWPAAGWLTALNTALYAAVWLRRRDQARPALYLALFSLLSLLPLLSRSCGGTPVPSQPEWTGSVTVLLVAVVALAVWCRHPLAGVAGACGLSLLVGHYALTDSPPVQLMLATALAFLLLHSLFWDDARHPGCQWLRHLAAFGWAVWAAALLLPRGGWSPLLLHAALAAPVAALLVGVGRWSRRRELLVPAAATGTVSLQVPLKGLITLAQWGATGPLVMLLAFACLGFGTWLAWRRQPLPAPAPEAAAATTSEEARHDD